MSMARVLFFGLNDEPQNIVVEVGWLHQENYLICELLALKMFESGDVSI